MVNQTETKIFETDDVKLVAYLFCLRFRLSQPPYLKGPIVYFSFPDTPELQEEAKNFWSRTPKHVDLQLYASKLTQARALVRSYRLFGGGRDE